ncbi:MmcQ/YjbR family DNA-binding protein [uncultured Nevskia sp.]|uniref:MmcQ/YjbR family DNA-binding protein n=1 Tax=uncultured Nevskia sp. TaxID=228950 RepID=UPI0025E9A3BB|nr:MmcQ/YjbR family DNA-binding protein [uncultured Nevskia sp.]
MTAKKSIGLSFEDVRRLALALPGVEDGTSYGTPALKLRGKLFLRLREDGETLVVPADAAAREYWMQIDPKTFFITDHYIGYDRLLVRLPGVRETALKVIIEAGWRRIAPAKLLTQHLSIGEPRS